MAKIGEVLSKIKEVFVGHKLSPAEKVFAEIGGSRRNVKNILSSEEREKNSKKEQAKRDTFAKGLAYVEGDPSKGLNVDIRLTENDLIKMKELSVNYRYLNDTVFGNLITDGSRVKLMFPDGIPGMLYIKYSPEKGAVSYSITKNCNRGEDRIAA